MNKVAETVLPTELGKACAEVQANMPIRKSKQFTKAIETSGERCVVLDSVWPAFATAVLRDICLYEASLFDPDDEITSPLERCIEGFASHWQNDDRKKVRLGLEEVIPLVNGRPNDETMHHAIRAALCAVDGDVAGMMHHASLAASVWMSLEKNHTDERQERKRKAAYPAMGRLLLSAIAA